MKYMNGTDASTLVLLMPFVCLFACLFFWACDEYSAIIRKIVIAVAVILLVAYYALIPRFGFGIWTWIVFGYYAVMFFLCFKD
jgi:hypothetical protein